jgi:hypothetical protein
MNEAFQERRPRGKYRSSPDRRRQRYQDHLAVLAADSQHPVTVLSAELATGPVWLAETIEPLLAAGGPEPRAPGKRLSKFEVTAHDSRALPEPD